jgi:hypothetical protein
VHCAIVMDLVGHDVPVLGMEDLVFLTGTESDPADDDEVRPLSGSPGLVQGLLPIDH